MLNKLDSKDLKMISVAMSSITIKGSDSIDFARVLEIIGKAYEKAQIKEGILDPKDVSK